MDIFQVFSILLLFTAIFSYLNERYLKFPTSIGLMVISLILAVGIILLGEFGGVSEVRSWANTLVEMVDFNELLLRGMLGSLLLRELSTLTLMI